MTPEDQIKRYTVPEFASRIRAKYPAYKDLSDDDLTDRILRKHPQYKTQVSFETRARSQEAAEAEVARLAAQSQAAANAYVSAGGKGLNPDVTPGTDYFRPLTTTEKAAQKRGEPVIISSTQPQTAPVAPETASRPRRVTEPPVSLAPVVQGRLEQIQKQNRQKEIQQKVQQARQVRERAQGLVLPKGQRNQGAAYQPKFGMGQTYREVPKLNKTIPNLAETLVEKPLTFEQDRAQRTARKQAIDNAYSEARKRGIKIGEIKASVEAEMQRPEPYTDQYGTRVRLSRPDPSRVEAETLARTQAAIAEHDRKQRVSQMGTGGYLAQAPKALIGAPISGAGTALKGLAVATRKLADQVIDTRGLDTRDTYVYQLGEALTKVAKDNPLFKSNPDLEQEFLVGKAPDAIGQSALFLLGGWVSQSPKMAITILGGGLTAGDAYDEVRSMGGTDEQAVNAGLIAGGLLGPTELLGMRGAINAIEGTVAANTLREALKTALREGRRDVAENALQEIGQEAAQGLITGNARSLPELAEAGLLGGIGGIQTVPTSLASSAMRGSGTNIVSDYLAASPLSTPEEKAAVEQVSAPDQKPDVDTKKPNVFEPTVEKPQQIAPDQSAVVESPKAGYKITKESVIVPETSQNAPVSEITGENRNIPVPPEVSLPVPTVETPAEVKTQPSATESVPPPAPDVVRLYRADAPDAPAASGKNWANSVDYVSQKYGAGQMGGEESIWYIDIPKAQLDEAYGDWRAVSGTTMDTLKANDIEVEPKLYRRINKATLTPAVTPAPEPTKTAATESQLPQVKEAKDVTQEAVKEEGVRPSESVKVEEVADISPSNEEAKRATIPAKPLETKPIATQLSDWGGRLRSIAQSKDLNALQALSDEMAAHKDDPRVARLRTAIQDELARARQPEIPERAPERPTPQKLSKTAQKTLAQAEAPEGKTIRPAPTHRIGAPKPDASRNSLEQQVRAYGGVKDDASQAYKGELGWLKESATRGTVNQTGGISVEEMATKLAQDGYGKGVWWEGAPNNVDPQAFLQAVMDDTRGTKQYSTERDVIEDDPDVEAWDALVEGAGAELIERVSSGRATAADIVTLTREAQANGLSDRALDAFIGGLQDAVSEALPESTETGEGYTLDKDGTLLDPDGTPLFARQLPLTSDELIQEQARPKETDQRERLRREQSERDEAADPARAAARRVLEELKRRGMTVDEYARQGVLFGTAPSEEEIALLKEVERGQAKPEDTQASMFARGEAQKPSEFTVEGNRVSLNLQGAEILTELYEEASQAGQTKGRLRGTFERKGEALARNLDTLAARGREGAKELADAVRRAAKAGNGKVVLFYGESAKKHELFHEASDKANRLMSDRHADLPGLINTDTFRTMSDRLIAMGYPGSNLPLLVEEAAAHIAEGRYDQLGITREQAVDWMYKWFQSFEQANPNVNPREFQEMSDEATQARDEVYRTESALREPLPDQALPSVQERREGRDRESIAAAREPRDITQTEAFKQWFGDSKVVDEDGKPLVVYHGTGEDFDTFDPDRAGSNIDSGWLGKGIYASDNQETGSSYASLGLNLIKSPQVMPLYFSIKRPFYWGTKTRGIRDLVLQGKSLPTEIHDAVIQRTGFEVNPDGESHINAADEKMLAEAITAELKERGYDGIIAETTTGKEIVAFNPSQIKSATGNRGTFDPNDPNILMARSGEERLTEKQFYRSYYQHKVLRKDADLTKLQSEGWKGGIGPQALPASRGGEPSNIVDRNYGIRAGDTVLLVPKEFTYETPNGTKIKDGWKPTGSQIVVADRDYQPAYELYLKGLESDPLFARSGDPWANLTELSDEFGRLANEPELAPGEKPLSLPQTLEDAGLEAGPARGYLPESIVDDGLERAKQVISEKGIDGAIEFVKTGDGIEWASTGYEVSARLREEESQLRAEGKAEEADKTRDKRLTFLDDFASAAVERGRSIVGIKAISMFAPDRMALNLNKASRKNRKRGISPEEESKITKLGEELGLLEERNKELEKRLAEAASKAKHRTGTSAKPKKTDYQSKLEQQASTVLQTLKPKLGKLDFSGFEKKGQSGAAGVPTLMPPLPGDAELIAQYAAAQLAKFNTVAELNQHLVQEFGQDIEQYLPKIRQRAYAIRQEARLAEIEASDTEPKRRKTILSEIQKEISESLTAIREAQKAQDRALKAEKAAQAKSERAEARLEAKQARESEHEARKQEIKEARARLKQQRQEYKQASQAETKGYRETIKAQREAERKAELWDTPLRNAAAEARTRLKDATDPKDPQTADDLIAVAAEKFLPTEIGGNPRTGAVDPSRVYKDLKDEFPALVTKKNQGDLYKKGYQRIQDATAAAREAARMRSASAEAKRLWDELGIDVDAQAVLIQQAEVRRQTDELRRKAQAEFQRVSRSMIEKIWMEAQAIPRSLQSSIDAPIGRQGAYFLLTHPLETMKTAVPATLKGYGSIHVSDYIAREKELAQHPDYKLAVDSGLELSQTTGEGDPALVAEEQFQSSLASRFLPHVRLSEQGYVLGMNAQRLAMFSRLADVGRADGYTPETNPEFFEAVAQFVNDGTGRGTLPDALKRASALLNFFFFSTRLNVSRIQLLNDLFNPLPYIPERFNPARAVPGIGSYDPAMRKVMVQELLRLEISVGIVLIIAAAMGIKVEFDPDDPDGLLLRIRNTRYDITGGEAGTIKFLYRLMKSIYRTAAEEDLQPFEQPLAIIGKFLRYKLAPLPSGTIDAITGKDAVGQPANLKKFESPRQVMQENVIIKRALPILAGNVLDTVTEEGWIGVPMVLPALAGFGVSSYPDRGIRAIKNQAVVDLLESLKITSNSLLGQKTKDEALDKVIQARIMEKVETLDIPQGATEVGKEKIVKERLAQIRNLARAEAAIAEPKLYADYLKSKEGSESVSVLTDEEKKTLTEQDLTNYRSRYAEAYVEMLQRASQAPNWSKLTDDEKEKVLARIPRIAHNRAKIDLVKTKRKGTP